jgi:PIN domain nuclease of toxin-antitoxin system
MALESRVDDWRSVYISVIGGLEIDIKVQKGKLLPPLIPTFSRIGGQG